MCKVIDSYICAWIEAERPAREIIYVILSVTVESLTFAICHQYHFVIILKLNKNWTESTFVINISIRQNNVHVFPVIGFYSGHSTVFQLIDLYHQIAQQSFDSKTHTWVVCCDIFWQGLAQWTYIQIQTTKGSGSTFKLDFKLLR